MGVATFSTDSPRAGTNRGDLRILPSMDAMYGRPRSRRWTRVAHGVYVSGDPTPIDHLQALSLVLPARAAYTHLTAARLLGWWLPGPVELEHPVFVATRAGDTIPQRRGIRVTRLADWPTARVVAGVRVASAPEILLAAARDLGVLDLVPLGDAALRLEHTTVEDLERVAAGRRAGSVQLRRVIPLLDARSESPWESILRVLHRAADIEVEPQREFFDADGRFVARADLWLVGTRRVHEFDGADHRTRDGHRRDLRRERGLVRIGLERCGYTSPEVLSGGGEIIASADRALGRRGEPARLRRWNALVDDSLWGATGRARVRRRWKSVG